MEEKLNDEIKYVFVLMKEARHQHPREPLLCNRAHPFPAPGLAAQHPHPEPGDRSPLGPSGGRAGSLGRGPTSTSSRTAKQQPGSALLASHRGPQPVAPGAKRKPPSLVAGSSRVGRACPVTERPSCSHRPGRPLSDASLGRSAGVR